MTEKLLQAMNEQVNHELASANVYLAMAAYFADEGYEGFSRFFIVQAVEEREHAMKFFHFIHELGHRAAITGCDDPRTDYGSVKEVFQQGFGT